MRKKSNKRKLQRTIGIGPVMPTTRVWLKSFSGKSATTRRGRKLPQADVLQVFGFGLAATREERHPGDVVPVYKEMIAPILKQANNAAYAEAAKLLGKIGELMGRLDRVTEFEEYLAALRVEYKRKRNFIKLLEGFETS